MWLFLYLCGAEALCYILWCRIHFFILGSFCYAVLSKCASRWGKFTLIWIHVSSQVCFPLRNSISWMYQCVPGVAPVNYHLHINQRVLVLLLWCQDWPCWLHSGLQCCSQGMATGFPSPGIFSRSLQRCLTNV